jgi:hypothetical protein
MPRLTRVVPVSEVVVEGVPGGSVVVTVSCFLEGMDQA